MRKEHLRRHWDQHHRSRGCVLSLASHSLCLSQSHVPLMPHPWVGCTSSAVLWAEIRSDSACVLISTPSVYWWYRETRQKSKMSFFYHLKKQRWIWCLTEGWSSQILRRVRATFPFFPGIRGMGLTKIGPLSASLSLRVYKETPTHGWEDLFWIDFEYHRELHSISHWRVSCWWATCLPQQNKFPLLMSYSLCWCGIPFPSVLNQATLNSKKDCHKMHQGDK